MAYRVQSPDLAYYQSAIRCQAACPVRTDARGYVTAIASGDTELAYRLARESNPFASICGRICAAPCEDACRRGFIDMPISIRPLKRFVAERHGVESLHPAAPDGPPGPSISQSDRSALKRLAAEPGRRLGRVAVIGSGPAGLAAAHDLAILGHRVTVFEAADTTGGMLRQGVPLYRLARELLDREIQAILDLGVELQLGAAVGDDISLAQLRRDFDAVFIGAGLRKGRDLQIEGVDLDGVFKAVDFLLNANLGFRVDLGARVIVVGGGNVAVDAARTALRAQLAQADLDQLSPEDLRGLVDRTRETMRELADAEIRDGEILHSAFDVARTAIRLGAAEVVMVALEDWHELPASRLEIEEAQEEGIQIRVRLGPNRIVGRAGKVVGLETIRVSSVFDASGRFNPGFIPDSEELVPCDSVILAIGQSADLQFLEGAADLQVTPRGLIAADPETMATTAPGVWAGGDVVYGPRILIEAVRDGQRAARSIEAHVQGRSLQVQRSGKMQPAASPRRGLSSPQYLRWPREEVPTTPLDRRIGIAEVETGFEPDQALRQSDRCLDCAVNTIFDSGKCILCGACADVCPWDCLKLVRLVELDGDVRVGQVLAAVGARGGAIIKNEDLCTRCGLCAERCPTGAISMEHFTFVESLSYA
ncbi:MAG TPA: FAD-dependent oxidoreductase [Anaerolineales bacterium]|nr:FAD-dependent oxidoreductase [Anaerolineales bacterium]